MINSADKYTLAEIFNVDNQIKYKIPKYQREYTWTKDNWEELINDIIDSDGNHFIGSIICINNSVDSFNIELEVVDGQQRLTTISLLFCAIYQLLKVNIQDNEDNLLELGNLKGKLVQRKTNRLKLELSSQNNNFSDYKSVLSEIGVFEYSAHVSNKGNRKIYKCFRYYLDFLKEYDEKSLLDLLDKIINTLLVKIEVDSHSDAFILFESLNNRGIPLSVIDLIKNKILAELEKREILSPDEAFDKWNIVINNLQDYVIQERFLRQYYNAFKFSESKVKVDGVTKATRSNLIKIYEKIINENPEFIFNEFIDKSLVYRDLISPTESDSGIIGEFKNELIDLVNVKAAPSYTFLLYIFSLENKFGSDFYRELVTFLVKYFIRRNITDFPNTRNLDQIFMDLIENLEKDKDNLNISYIKDFLSNKDNMSSEDFFKEKLNGDIYDANIDATRFILSKIEESKSTKEIHTDFWKRDNSKKLIWTIEHVFPEGKNIPNSWVEMISDDDEEKAKEIQGKWVHKLGNLTLTGFNSNLSNFDFTKKRDREKDGKTIGYKNGLFLNEDLKNKDEWTESDIIERTHRLVGLALDIFKID